MNNKNDDIDSRSSDYFNYIIGLIEDVVIDDEFQVY